MAEIHREEWEESRKSKRERGGGNRKPEGV